MKNCKTMRVTGGHLVRRRFKIPEQVDEGTVRPTPDRVRESLFSILDPMLLDAKILDIFSGSGAHGYEAISRGAKSVIFVEKNPRVAKNIQENIDALGIGEQAKVHIVDALNFVSSSDETFDLVFLDPPYSLKLDEGFFEKVAKLLVKESCLVFRCFKKDEVSFPKSLEVTREKVYGGTRVYFLKLSPI